MPASYPGAVKAFSNKSAGNVIQPGDCNDLQDEVMAIEGGLINGTAPLNSSNSTHANLSVTGGSTLAALTATNSTLATLSLSGNCTIAGELFVTKPPPYARVFNTAKLDIAHNALTALTFDSDRILSTSTMHSTGSNPARLIAPSSGAYLITGHIAWQSLAGVSTATLDVAIRLNGVTVIAQHGASANHTSTESVQSVATLYSLAAADYVELCVYQSQNSTASIKVIGNYSPEFTLTKIR